MKSRPVLFSPINPIFLLGPAGRSGTRAQTEAPAGSRFHQTLHRLHSSPGSFEVSGKREGGLRVFLGGGGILWLTGNFLSCRTNVAGKLHQSPPQRFDCCHKGTEKSFRAGGRRSWAAGAATCRLIPVLIPVPIRASVSWQREGGGLPLVAEGDSTLQTLLLVGL